MRAVLIVLIALAACKDPPPITAGKCRIMSYNGEDPETQECVFEGYLWLCSSSKHWTCTRGAQVAGEARPAP